MPKNARKRQKVSNVTGDHGSERPIPNKAARLEMLLDEESKDDEERRLESLLFGVKYVPKGEDLIINHDEDEGSSDEMDNQGGRGLQHLLDDDVCFCDILLPAIILIILLFYSITSSYFS